MDFLENIILSLNGLRANKMRALLTMLGIIIGIASVIAIVTVGNSLNASITSSMEAMGANSIVVNIREKGDEYAGGPRSPGATTAMPDEDDLLSEDMIQAFKERFDDKIEVISISHGIGAAKAQDERLYANVSILGVNDGYNKANNIELITGRFIIENDIKSVKKVAVVSDKFVGNMFSDYDNPLGKEVKIYASDTIETYIIVGIYQYESTIFTANVTSEKDMDTNFYIPVSLAKQDATTKNYQNVTVVTKTGIDATYFSEEIQSYFAKLYADNTKWEAGVTNMESTISSMTSILDTVTMAITVIAGISLLVGGIGVMNIMLVSVTERTREIGTRKALGARNFHIKIQFIVESVIICVIGGLIGIILGLFLGFFGASLLGYPATASFGIIVISVSLTMFIGIFFGYYPANKAAKLNPIEALRYE